MSVTSLELRSFWLFEKIRFDFDPRVNVFIGPNNSGKTTVLLALAAGMGRSTFPVKSTRPEGQGTVEWSYGSATRRMIFTAKGPQVQRGDPEDVPTPADKAWTMFVPALRLSTDYRSRGPGRMARDDDEETWPQRGESWTADREIIERIIELDYRSHLKSNPAIRKALDRTTDLAGRITEGFPI